MSATGLSLRPARQLLEANHYNQNSSELFHRRDLFHGFANFRALHRSRWAGPCDDVNNCPVPAELFSSRQFPDVDFS
jgi:hypothetical protein